MKLDIPQEDRELLRRWLATDDEPFEEVMGVLDAAMPTLRPSTLAKCVAEQANIVPTTASDVVLAFCSLARSVTRFDDQDKQDMLGVFFRSILMEPVDAQTKQIFEARVQRVVSSKSVQVSAKAFSVLLDNSNTYCFARTLSELRPIFGEADLEPEAIVVVHQLKIVYHSGPRRQRHEMFLALNRDDILDLQQVLNRALEKDNKLNEMANRIPLPRL